jgi:hypothetical protein
MDPSNPRIRLRRLVRAVLLVAVGCGASDSLVRRGDVRSFTKPAAIHAQRVDTERVDTQQADNQQAVIREAVIREAAVPQAPPERLLRRYASSFAKLSYSPHDAKGLDCIQKQPTLALDAAELALHDRHGFVISRKRPFSTFALAYLDLFHFDEPVFISADAILHAWHRAYDGLLVDIERNVFKGALDHFLQGVKKRVAATGAAGRVRGFLDTHLTVAHSLLLDNDLLPLAGGSESDVVRLYTLSREQAGLQTVSLFGEPRLVDFTQFKPRGHYEKHPDLIPYFRAMMWLGQIDFRPIETTPTGEQVFHRSQFDALVAAREAMDAETLEQWHTIDRLVGLFVGKHDGMGPDEVDGLVRDAGLDETRELYRLSDDAVRALLGRTDYGKQSIMGHPAVKLPGVPRLALNRSFAFFGQRYSLDSHTLHAVTEDRVPDRDLPEARDVGFATFGNDFALTLASKAERTNRDYVRGLTSMRALSDEQNEADWQNSLYSTWIWALRGLSPNLAKPPAAEVARTEAWARRLLATQLASWSELRHDTILYAKQSYSVQIVCEYPDAYVDPYPAVFHRLVAQSELGERATAQMDLLPLTPPQKAVVQNARSYFSKARDILTKLEAMAERNARGQRLTAEQLAFVNTMIKKHVTPPSRHGCGGGGSITYDGWYRDLLNGASLFDPDITVADVHTGVTGVLHVGKRQPRRMVVTIDWKDGPRAYVGAVYSYHELVAPSRISDSEFAQLDPPDPAWMTPIVAHARADAGRH